MYVNVNELNSRLKTATARCKELERANSLLRDENVTKSMQIEQLSRSVVLRQDNIDSLEDEVAGLRNDLTQVTLSRAQVGQQCDLWKESALYWSDVVKELDAELSKARGVDHAQVDRLAEKISCLEAVLVVEKQDKVDIIRFYSRMILDLIQEMDHDPAPS